MTWNNIPPEKRFSLWKSFRKENETETEQIQIENTANFFAKFPIGARSLDFYTPESWPTPWEILYYNSLCQNSISLLMYYTLQLIPTFNLDMELLLIDDGEDRYLIPFIDNKFILNYELGRISKWSHYRKKLKIIDKFTDKQIKTVV